LASLSPSPIPLPPTPHTPVDFIPRYAILHKTHDDPEHLYVLIPRLIIKEQHLLIRDARIPMYPLEMRRLAAGVYLQVIKVVYRALGGGRGGARDLEKLEHFAAQVGGVGARGGGYDDRLLLELGIVRAGRDELERDLQHPARLQHPHRSRKFRRIDL